MVYLNGIKLDPVNIDRALEIVVQSIGKKSGDYFCFVNLHLFMEGQKDQEVKTILNNSAGNFPDGMGVAIALKLLGHKFKGRVRGADFMLKLCEYAAQNDLKIYLYGNTEDTLFLLKDKLMKKFPGISIVGYYSPPFKELTDEENNEIIQKINNVDPDIIFVSLGAPKQEKWMARNKGKIRATQFGVGAAFDFLTGKIKVAPVWMQKAGLEWLYRLPQQPLKTTYRMSLVPEFLWLLLKALLQGKRSKYSNEKHINKISIS